jgi:TPR repeat protein
MEAITTTIYMFNNNTWIFYNEQNIQSTESVEKLFLQSAEKGNSDAMYLFGILYKDGNMDKNIIKDTNSADYDNIFE